jgi:hypothetical protein
LPRSDELGLTLSDGGEGETRMTLTMGPGFGAEVRDDKGASFGAIRTTIMNEGKVERYPWSDAEETAIEKLSSS